MTPDKARRLLDGTTPGPWKWRWDAGLISLFGAKGESVATDLDVRDSDLAAAAPILARMVAGMHEEWGIVAIYLGRHEVEKWGFDTREDALDEASALDLDEVRIVRRYVTTPEEADATD